MKKKTNYLIFAGIALLIIVILIFSSGKEYKGVEITVYKSPSCGCCGNYIPYLKGEGFEVTVVNVDDISGIKEEYGVPDGFNSCHTTVIGNYFVEGHVPLEAIDKLLTENPEIDGITLPNMPSGSPGMPGVKRGDFIIYSVIDGEISEFMRV